MPACGRSLTGGQPLAACASAMVQPGQVDVAFAGKAVGTKRGFDPVASLRSTAVARTGSHGAMRGLAGSLRSCGLVVVAL